MRCQTERHKRLSRLLLEIKRHRGANQILQGSFVETVLLVNINRASDAPLETGVEQMRRVLQGSPVDANFFIVPS